MLANGFQVEMLVELIRTGLASAQAERMMAGSKQIEVARVRITEAWAAGAWRNCRWPACTRS
jgi:hypothetical protein